MHRAPDPPRYDSAFDHVQRAVLRGRWDSRVPDVVVALVASPGGGVELKLTCADCFESLRSRSDTLSLALLRMHMHPEGHGGGVYLAEVPMADLSRAWPYCIHAVVALLPPPGCRQTLRGRVRLARRARPPGFWAALARRVASLLLRRPPRACECAPEPVEDWPVFVQPGDAWPMTPVVRGRYPLPVAALRGYDVQFEFDGACKPTVLCAVMGQRLSPAVAASRPRLPTGEALFPALEALDAEVRERGWDVAVPDLETLICERQAPGAARRLVRAVRKELAERVWHPSRVARGLTELDPKAWF